MNSCFPHLDRVYRYFKRSDERTLLRGGQHYWCCCRRQEAEEEEPESSANIEAVLRSMQGIPLLINAIQFSMENAYDVNIQLPLNPRNSSQACISSESYWEDCDEQRGLLKNPRLNLTLVHSSELMFPLRETEESPPPGPKHSVFMQLSVSEQQRLRRICSTGAILSNNFSLLRHSLQPCEFHVGSFESSEEETRKESPLEEARTAQFQGISELRNSVSEPEQLS